MGYAFSIPFGPFTMKLAETPSSRAGLIISVFGVPSSPMLTSEVGKERTGEGRLGQGSRELTPGHQKGADRPARALASKRARSYLPPLCICWLSFPLRAW